MDRRHRRAALREAAAEGVRKGFRGFLWMLKILLPISFLTALGDHTGLLHRLDFLVAPLMGLLGLPAAAAFPLLIGLLTGVYGCIAAMAVLPLTTEQMTVIAVFILIAHNLPQESLIQANSGIGFAKTTLVRLAAAAATSAAVGWWLAPGGPAEPAAVAAAARPALSFAGFLGGWLRETGALALKILVIIVAVMVVIELMKRFHLAAALAAALGPLLGLMGLDRRAGVLWLTGALFGLSYGGAVIIEQARELDLTAPQIEKLQLSIGINHAVIEDPLIFLPLGLSPFWMWVPRLAAAIAVVYLAELWFRLRRRRPAAG